MIFFIASLPLKFRQLYQFKIKLRKDFGFKKSKGKDKIVEGQVYFRKF